MKKLLSLLFAFTVINKLSAQNLFPQVITECNPKAFCLDCGDVKTNFDVVKFDKAKIAIEQDEEIKRLDGQIHFQIILDSKGKACVLSYDDESNSTLTQKLIALLNNFDGWIKPVFEDRKSEEPVSFNFLITILNGKIQGNVERANMEAFMDGFDHPQNPEIENTSFLYKNENLNRYSFEIWNKRNSANPDNMNDAVTISTNGDIWFTLNEGLYRYNGKDFIDSRQNITHSKKYFTYYTVAADREGRTWVAATEGLYCFENEHWKKYDSVKVGFKDINKIVVNKWLDEVFFCTDNGLFIYKNKTWQTINRKTTPLLPTDEIEFAKRDSKGRIWIGTFKGSVMIEGNKVMVFNKTNHVLNEQCILSLDENEKGILFMGLNEYKKKGGEKTNDGIVAYESSSNQWKQFTVSNSGLPVNSTEDLVVDNDNIVWIVTSTAGLVRFDPSLNLWENYNNDNSPIPTSWIMDIEKDKVGNLILGTRQGLVRLSKK